METNQTGNITVLAGVIAGVLAHFNIGVTATDIATVISAVLIVGGVAKQWYDHKTIVANLNSIVASQTMTINKYSAGTANGVGLGGVSGTGSYKA